MPLRWAAVANVCVTYFKTKQYTGNEKPTLSIFPSSRLTRDPPVHNYNAHYLRMRSRSIMSIFSTQVVLVMVGHGSTHSQKEAVLQEI